MKTITVELSDADAASVDSFLAESGAYEDSERGKLTFETLAAMLLEDVALMVRRPGSWEGAGMREVMGRHGYPY